MPDIYNDEQLNNILSDDFSEIINKMADRVVEEVVKKAIQEEVYNAYSPSTYTHRDESSGRFIDSWEQNTDFGKAGGGTTFHSEIESNPSLMDLDMKNYVHGSSLYGDVRAMLSDYIISGTNYNFGFDMPRDFWSPILLALQDGSIDKIIESEMSKFGLNWIKS